MADLRRQTAAGDRARQTGLVLAGALATGRGFGRRWHEGKRMIGTG
jgi:hypothetical protein